MRLSSLQARIFVGLGIVLSMLLVLAVVLVTSLSQLGGAIETILRENYRSVVACEEMNEALERLDSAVQFASTGHDDIAAPMLAANRRAFDDAFQREAHNITLPGEGARVRVIDSLYRDYVSTVDRALASPGRAELYFRELLPRFSHIKVEIQQVLRMNQQNMEDADGRAKSMARERLRIGLAASLLALLFGVIFVIRLPRSVIRPVRALADVARGVGEGELQAEVEVPEVRELVPLADALRKMLERLRAYRESSLGELLAAKDLANATVSCLIDPVAVLGPDGDIVLTNRAAEQTFGLRVGSADELRAADVAIPPAFALARDRVLKSHESVAPRNFSEAMRWRQNETEKFFLIRAAPLRGEPGEKLRAIVVAQDVTRFRRIDELKSDMVATVSHEFKTPLTSLRMATHLLLEPTAGPLTDAQREIITTARDDTERLRAMVDELLDLVRIEAEAGELHRTSIDPRRLIRAVIDAHRAIAREKGVDLAIDERSAVQPASVDSEKLSIVLANLVSNAIRHTPSGGRVALSADATDGVLRINVHDTGEGIEADALPHLFDRGSATRAPHATREQHGLGLTIAREIVLQHGGDLVARSTRGEGSTFTITLPLD